MPLVVKRLTCSIERMPSMHRLADILGGHVVLEVDEGLDRRVRSGSLGPEPSMPPAQFSDASTWIGRFRLSRRPLCAATSPSRSAFGDRLFASVSVPLHAPTETQSCT
jgi:hypothetical protein